jgi:hypothetical protein
MIQFYKVDTGGNFDLIQLDSSNVPQDIIQSIEDFQEEVALLYLNKQIGRKGISSLGTEIRYSKRIDELFLEKENRVLLKSTRNRSELLSFFINSVVEYSAQDLYFLFLGRNLNQHSKIFDSSSIYKEDWERLLRKFSRHLSLKANTHNIYLLEITSFSNYIFDKYDKRYSRIIPK